MLSAGTRLAGRTLRASTRDLLLRLATAACVVLTVDVARAGDVEAARKKFEAGVRLFQKSDYEGARRLFREADAEHHAAPIVYNLGLAEEKLGHLQAAVDAYEAYVAEVGAAGELSSSATIAIAQIKARTTKLRIETKPTGARVFVDGSPLNEPAPTTFLVAAGHHVVVAQGDGWRAERDLEARGAGDVSPVSLEAPVEALAPVPAPASSAESRTPAPSQPPIYAPELERPRAPAPPLEMPEGLVWGASFAIAPTYLLGVDTPGADNQRNAVSIVAGPLLEIGWALTERFEFIARGFAGIGPDGKPSWAYMGGPGLSLRVAPALWVGAVFIGGQFETRRHGARYGTDQVFGAMAEVSLVVIAKPHGQWTASFQPGLLLADPGHDNTAVFFPFAFGYRGF